MYSPFDKIISLPLLFLRCHKIIPPRTTASSMRRRFGRSASMLRSRNGFYDRFVVSYIIAEISGEYKLQLILLKTSRALCVMQTRSACESSPNSFRRRRYIKLTNFDFDYPCAVYARIYFFYINICELLRFIKCYSGLSIFFCFH